MSIVKEIDEPKCPHPTSLLNAACRSEAGDFSTQSFNRAQPHFLTPSCGSARNDIAADRLHFFGIKKLPRNQSMTVF